MYSLPKTLTGNSPQREQRVQMLLLDRISIKYQRRIAREITRAMNDMASGPTTKKQAKHESKMRRILNALWLDSGEAMGKHIGNHEKCIGWYETKKTGGISNTLLANTVMRSWIGVYGSEKIVGITDTTRDQVSNIISKGVDEGLSATEVSKLIRSISAFRGSSRAATITRTETHSAANVAAQATAKAAGVKMRRRWSSAKNERTRKAHRDADGQIVGMDEPFRVGGYDLMYPSDYASKAPASLTINCRCAVAYIL